jgi:hypothetical protein
VATREVALSVDGPPASYGASDTYAEYNHFDAPQVFYQNAQTWIGDGQAKNLGLLDSLHRFLSTIPTGSNIIKSKITMIAGGSKNPPHSDLQVGLVDRDGRWDAPAAGVVGSNEHLHWTMVVTNSDGERVNATQPTAYGGQPPLGASIAYGGFGEACHTFGMKFKAWTRPLGNAHTLDRVYCRLRRESTGGGDRSSTKLRVKIYDVTSPTDPRPSGPPLATSDDVTFLSLPTTMPPSSPWQGWAFFLFTGLNAIEIDERQEYVAVLEVDPQPTEAPYACWVLNDDRQSGVDQGTTPWDDVHMIATVPTCGFHYNHYPCHDLLDLPMFGYLDVFQYPHAYILNTAVSFGDAGYSPNHVMTPSLGALIQSYIDDPEYDESGTPIGIRLHSPNPSGGFVTFYSEEYGLGYDPMVLTIEYDEPLPTKATNPSPAHLDALVSVDTVLRWTAGSYAGTGSVTHDVYFGTDPSPSFVGNQASTTYDPPGYLEPGTKYYWRVDEVGPFGTTTGDVWEFTTAASGPPRFVRGDGVVLPVVRSRAELRGLVSGLGRLVLLPRSVARKSPLVSGSSALVVGVSSRSVLVPVVSGNGEVKVVPVSAMDVVEVFGRGELLPLVSGSSRLAPLVSGEGELIPLVAADASVLDEV